MVLAKIRLGHPPPVKKRPERREKQLMLRTCIQATLALQIQPRPSIFCGILENPGQIALVQIGSDSPRKDVPPLPPSIDERVLVSSCLPFITGKVATGL